MKIIRTLALTASCTMTLACNSAAQLGEVDSSGVERLTARPQSNITTLAAGTYGLLVAVPKDALLTIPSSAPATEVPLVVMLHGAGGTPNQLDQIVALSEKYGFAVLVPKSRGNTWDLALGGFGNDVSIINKALTETFKKVNVDRTRIALAGFSDGASYALSLGLANGDLFTHLISFAPGFLSGVQRHGKPEVFIAHGNGDGILPVENTRNNIVPFLRSVGYTVRYDEFPGGHQVDPVEADTAFTWLLH